MAQKLDFLAVFGRGSGLFKKPLLQEERSLWITGAIR